MAKATGTLVSVEEYLRADYSPDCDYVDGELLERNVGENEHSYLQKAFLLYLSARERQLGIYAIQEQRVQISPTRYRVPDLCVVAGSRPSEPIFTSPPILCIEIVSPEDRMSRVQEKIDDYLNFGVRCVWVIDPKTRRAWTYTLSGITEAKDGMLRAPLSEDRQLTVPLSELFS